jgi:pimeloyl-ACP methyl ester carboxylesterase/class 3 adenylate cyclase
MAQPETRYARSGDVHVAYQVHGEGPVDLVFVPGFVSNLAVMWEWPSYARFLTRLGTFSRVIHFDKRGTGLSDRVPDIPTIEQRMDDVRAVMDAAGSGSAVVFGISEGGPMALLFAAAHPERVRALVLFGSYACYSVYVLSPERMRRYMADIEAGWGTGVTLPYLAPAQAGDPELRAWWKRLEQLGASPAAALQVVRMNAEIDVRPVLPSIKVPTFVIHRTADPRVPVEAGRFLAATIPGARLVEVPGDAHPFSIGDADRVADEIEGFVTGVRPVPAGAVGDRRLAAVLVAELDGADRIAAALGDEVWAARMAGYRAELEAAVEAFRGRVSVAPGADGTCIALFDGPARAVRCGAALREGAERRLGCGLRCGVHVGEVAEPPGGPAEGGTALHTARRIAGAAKAGEVLVSGMVRDLVAGSGLRFRDRHVRLPGGPGAEAQRLQLLALAGDDRPRAASAGPPAPRRCAVATLPGGAQPARREVLRLIARGLSNPAIAASLSVSEHTVKAPGHEHPHQARLAEPRGGCGGGGARRPALSPCAPTG